MATHSSNYPHFWLYAKCWYKRGDLIEDTKRLVANYCGGNRQHVSLRDCFDFWMCTFEEASRYCKIHEADHRKILNKIWQRQNPEDILSRLYQPEKAEYIIINAIVETLSVVAVMDSKFFDKNADETPFIEFGKPDPNVLPLSKDALS